MNESRRVAISPRRDREREIETEIVPSEVDEEGRKNDRGLGGRGGRERRPDGPLALSQTVAAGPETNLDQEPRERRERKRTEHYMLVPFSSRASVLFYSSIPLFFSSSPLCVAPIINISPSPCLTARSSAHRCCCCLLGLLLSRASPPPGSSGNVHRADYK